MADVHAAALAVRFAALQSSRSRAILASAGEAAATARPIPKQAQIERSIACLSLPSRWSGRRRTIVAPLINASYF
jgi:hypothetical protein